MLALVLFADSRKPWGKISVLRTTDGCQTHGGDGKVYQGPASERSRAALKHDANNNEMQKSG
jgi:hypothetical protein